MTIGLLAFVATAASFAWSMRGNWGTSTADSEYIEPDPQVLKAFVAPEGFRAARDVPACFISQESRCYLAELSLPQVLAAAEQWTDSTADAERKSYMGHVAYGWCSDALGAPAYFSVTPNLINAKKLGPGSWQLPDEPKFDDQWVLAVALAESTCD